MPLRHLHRPALGLLVAVVLAACGPAVEAPPIVGGPSAPGPVIVPSGSPADVAVGQPTPGDAPLPDAGQPPGDAGGPDAPPAQGEGQVDGPAPAPEEAPQPVVPAALPALDGTLGSLCRTYLQPQTPRLVIEVDAQQGAELPDGVLAHLRDSLAAVVDKPGGVVLQAGGVVPGGAEAWTIERVRQIAGGTRDVAHGDGTAVMHVLSLAGAPDQDSTISTSIGVAFAAGEFVVFPDRVDSLAALLGGVEAVLRAVTVHEAGHLLCLVNLSYTSDIPHEDPENPKHSASQGSVMFHAIETTAIGQLFSGAPPSSFDADDLADLEGLRTGRY